MIVAVISAWIYYVRGIRASHTDLLHHELLHSRIITGDIIIAEFLQGFRSENDRESDGMEHILGLKMKNRINRQKCPGRKNKRRKCLAEEGVHQVTKPTISWYEKNAERLSAEYDKSDVGPLHSLLRRWIPCRGNVLEIGCGSGRDAFYLASLGCFVVALDGSDAMLRAAQKRLGEEKLENILFQSALFPLPNEHPLLACKFDAITAIAVLMHFSDDELYSFACQVKALLKEKGIFLCSFSSGERTSIDERFYKNREPQEIQRLFEEAGLRILSRAESKDGLGRDIIWTTLVFSSELSPLLTE